MTEVEAFAYSMERAVTLKPRDFHYSVLMVTPDCSLMFLNCAIGEKHGDYYFIWTKHHGYFVEHQDAIARWWVCNHDLLRR